MVKTSLVLLRQLWLSCLPQQKWRSLARAIAGMLLLLGLASGVSFAQISAIEAPEVPPVLPSQPNLSANDISVEKVTQFVRAYVQVLHLIEQREGALQGAETQLEARQVEREIEAKALALIEEAGLTWQEYLQLLSLANIDPEFGEEVAAQLQESD